MWLDAQHLVLDSGKFIRLPDRWLPSCPDCWPLNGTLWGLLLSKVFLFRQVCRFGSEHREYFYSFGVGSWVVKSLLGTEQEQDQLDFR